jgi:hypothetical protein
VRWVDLAIDELPVGASFGAAAHATASAASAKSFAEAIGEASHRPALPSSRALAQWIELTFLNRQKLGDHGMNNPLTAPETRRDGDASPQPFLRASRETGDSPGCTAPTPLRKSGGLNTCCHRAKHRGMSDEEPTTFICCGCHEDTTQLVIRAIREDEATTKLDAPSDEIYVRCSNNHLCASPPDSPVIRGRAVSPDETAELASLRTALSPEGGFKVVDDFAKYLVASTAVLTAVGAGFSVSGFGELHGKAKPVFLTAIILMSFSLALAIISLRPRSLDYNPNSIESMYGAIDDVVGHRTRFLRWAAVCFAASLILAGAAHAVSTEAKDEPGLRFNLSEDGTLTGHVTVDDARPGSVVRASFTAKSIPRGYFLPREQTLADESGRANLELKLSKTAGLQTVRLVRAWRKKHAASISVDHLRIALPHRHPISRPKR